MIQQCREQRDMSIRHCTKLTIIKSTDTWKRIEDGKLLPEEFTPPYLAELFKAEERIFTRYYEAYISLKNKK